LARTDFRSGRWEAALAGFQQVAKVFPRQPAGISALYWAGASAVRLGQSDQALELLLRYLESSRSADSSPGGLAKAAEEEIRSLLVPLASGDDAGAARLRRFLRRVEASGVHEDLKNRARYEYTRFLFAGGGEEEEALRLALRLREAGLAEPLASENNLLIAEAYRRRGELDRALDIFSAITASRAGRAGASAQAGIARIAEEQGRREEAAEEYLKLYFLYPEEQDLAQEGLFQAGRLYWEAGRGEQARKLFDKLSAEFPESPWLRKLPSR